MKHAVKDEKVFTPDRADWLVESRAQTQRVSAKLYRLLNEYPDEVMKFGMALQMLIAISFSLWRSAFLSDKMAGLEFTHAGLTKLLSEMLENNAIAYSQERAAKDWTFNYYAGNAFYRLEDLKAQWPKSNFGPLRPPEGKRSAERRWTYLQNAFAKAVDHFEKLLKDAKNSK